MTVTLRSRASDLPFPSLAQLMEYIATNEVLTPRQRQETCSALRTVSRVIGRRPEEIAASPRELRERLARLTPPMAGVTRGRWNNVVSLMRGALKHAGLATIAGRSTEPMRRVGETFCGISMIVECGRVCRGLHTIAV